MNDGQQYGGGFFWLGGGAQTHDGEAQVSFGPFSSSYFGFHLICGASPCTTGVNQLDVGQITLRVHETIAPNLVAPDGLWQTSGWVRGNWALHYYGDSPSGLCSLSATLAGQPIVGSSSTANSATWHQCAAPAVLTTVNTQNYGQGAARLTLAALDAAGIPESVSKTVYLDNTPPTISLSGPADAPTDAGVQYVYATAATSGPSGIAGISCSLDGAPPQWYPRASVGVPVQGLGVHHLTCWSSNNSRDSAGNLGGSVPATWTLSIRQPTVSALSFVQVVNALRCTRTRERVRVPAHWVTVRWRGQLVRVQVPSQTRIVPVTHCHPVVGRRRVRSHGHWRTERVVLLPHTVQTSTREAAYGAATTMSGWLGTSGGDALGGQSVQIIAAPDNGQQAFRQVAAATTASNGSWTTLLPAGPSRIVQAVYGGTVFTEPAISAQVHVVVPASVRLEIEPRNPHWGGTITIYGQLRGGYVPPAGEVLFVRLKYNGKQIEVEHVRTRSDGRFRTSYTFLGGSGTASYPFWVTTVPESDYPYSAGSSRQIRISVGP